MKIYTVVGARPNFLKIDPELPQTIIHTGQHFHDNMSAVFFRELGLPKPKYNLKCKGYQVGKMIDKLREILKKDKPDLVVVFGDTNSAVAGALAARYEHIKVAHIEAGMRSGTDMPEETNRIIIDNIATVNMCANSEAVYNLNKNGIVKDYYEVGDPMIDTLYRFLPITATKNKGKYILLTIHREVNATKDFLAKLFKILKDTDEQYIFPAHPRIKKFVKAPKNVRIIKPVGYKEMLSLEANAKKIITDSGGVQREGAWLGIPVIVVREETEWNDLLKRGSLVLGNLDNLKHLIENFRSPVFGAPTKGANKKIREILVKYV